MPTYISATIAAQHAAKVNQSIRLVGIALLLFFEVTFEFVPVDVVINEVAEEVGQAINSLLELLSGVLHVRFALRVKLYVN